MDSEAEALRGARLGAHLSMREMAELVGLNEAHVEALEQDAGQASTELLDRYARVFGLSLRHFLAGGAEAAPATVLFRSLHAEGPSFEDLVETGASFVLGEFLRCTADVAEVEALLGERRDRIAEELGAAGPEPVQDAPSLYRQAERLALDVRRRLGLGLEPVPSMIELVQDRLGVRLFWTVPDELDRDIDAASARAPIPAILVNLVGGAECWWRTRMTLAHELCHLLFDFDRAAGAARRTFLFSPHRGELSLGARRRGLRLPADIEQIERRANAFAAHFLAPPEAVRAAVGSWSPASDEAINAVCKLFQIGRLAAVNQITNTFRLSREERLAMVERGPSDVLPKQHADMMVLPGLRTGALREVVMRALSQGRIGRARARQYLALSSSDPLPDDARLSEEQRAPLHSPEHLARLAAQRYLAVRADLAACYPAAVTRDGERFRVEVERADEARWDAPLRHGYLLLSAGFEVLEGESCLGPGAATADAGS
jgi:transcriptional regulator with XRE-family HTH domain/Zn-dependent peptidase ImmA (M78 family)